MNNQVPTSELEPTVVPSQRPSLLIPILLTIVITAGVFGICGYYLGKQTVTAIYKTNEEVNLPQNIAISEKKLDIGQKDLRLRYLQTNNSVVTLLIDYSEVPQQMVINSWEKSVSVNSRPDLAKVTPSKVLLSADARFLVFETLGDGISVYDYRQSKLIRSLDQLIPEIEGTNIVSLTDNTLKLGLFEGVAGICDDNAFEVNLLDNSLIRLQDKTKMRKC